MELKVYLEKTIQLAQSAFEKNTYPVGAIIVSQSGEVIAEAHNQSFIDNDATAHAEILCIRKAGKKVMKNFNPEPTILFSNAEPCFGCGFFTRYTNIKTIVWAMNDPYKGSIEYLKTVDRLKNDFIDVKFIEEPFEDLRLKSRELYYKYFTNKENFKVAELFK